MRPSLPEGPVYLQELIDGIKAQLTFDRATPLSKQLGVKELLR
jgi:hypothetical protein